MELTVSHSSPFISRRCMASSQVNGFIPIKPTTKYQIKLSNFPLKCSTNKLIQRPIKLYGEIRFSKSLLSSQHNRQYIWACTKREFAGLDSELGKDQPESTVARVVRFGSIFYRFARPYTMTHLFISSICLFARVLIENRQLFKWSLLFKAFPGLIAVILANNYSNGINQIFDADIDRMNKPYLPLAAGDLSLTQAWFLTIFYALSGQLILWLMNADLITTCHFCTCLLLTTLYSAPPFRVKRSPVATPILISLMSIVHHGGILYASVASLGLPFQWSPPRVFIVAFAALFFFASCLVKDIPDVQGDKKYNIQTFAATFGPKKITILGTGIMLVTYIGAIAVAIFMPQAFKRHIILPTHLILVLWLLFQATKLDKANYVQEASTDFYRLIWKLLTLEFLLFLVI